MADYRVYSLSGDGQIHFAVNISARTDDEAVTLATNMNRGGHKCEVWEGRRLVASLSAEQLKD